MVAVHRTHRLSRDRDWIGGPVGRAMFGLRLAALERREIALADVERRAEGELVVVRGAIECAEPLQGVLVEATGVYRRMIFGAGGEWVHEAASDFALVGDRGQRVLVQAAGARWLVPARESLSYPASRLDRDGVAREVRELVRATGAATIEARELVLESGTEVRVIGYKTTSPDVSGEVQGYRMPPQRATLRAVPDLALVIL